MTAKPVVVYSTPITRNRPELSGSVRGRWKTNTLVAQKKTGNNRTVQTYGRLIRWSRVRAPPRPTLKGRSGVLQAGRTSQSPSAALNSECVT